MYFGKNKYLEGTRNNFSTYHTRSRETKRRWKPNIHSTKTRFRSPHTACISRYHYSTYTPAHQLPTCNCTSTLAIFHYHLKLLSSFTLSFDALLPTPSHQQIHAISHEIIFELALIHFRPSISLCGHHFFFQAKARISAMLDCKMTRKYRVNLNSKFEMSHQSLLVFSRK